MPPCVSEPTELELAIHAKPAFRQDVLMDGEVELLLSILTELLVELAHQTEAA